MRLQMGKAARGVMKWPSSALRAGPRADGASQVPAAHMSPSNHPPSHPNPASPAQHKDGESPPVSRDTRWPPSICHQSLCRCTAVRLESLEHAAHSVNTPWNTP